MATRIHRLGGARLAVRFGAVWLLALVIARGAMAGQPPALINDSSRPSTTTPAAADTSKKAATKTTAKTAAAKTAAHGATTKKSPAAPATATTARPGATAKTATSVPASVAKTPSVAKTAVVSKAPTSTPAKAPAVASASKSAAVPASKNAAVSKTATVATAPVSKAPVIAKVAPAPTKGAPPAPHAATTTVKTTPNPPTVGPNTASLAKPAAAVSKTAVAPPVQASNVALQRNASLSPTVSRTSPPTGGPRLAQSGGTVVRGPGSQDLTIGPPVPPNLSAMNAARKNTPNAASASATERLHVTTPAPVKGSGVSKSGGVTAPAPLEEHVTYQYNALGRRDPFQSLIDGGWVGNDVGGDAPPDVGGIKLVGIMWGANDQFAMCEDVRGNSYVLRRGDRVMNGYVEGLKQDAMIVSITVDGQSESVTIPITRKGDKSNANR